MFFLLVVVPLFIAAICFALATIANVRKTGAGRASYYSDNISAWGLAGFWAGIVSVVIALIFVGVSFNITNSQYDRYHDLVALDERYDLLVERRDVQVDVVRSELDGYPEFEQDIISGINSDIILSYPEIRTSEVLTAKVNRILGYNQDIFTLRDEVITIERDIYHNDDSPFVLRTPGLWPEWSDYFEGSNNPIFDGREPVIGEDLVRIDEED